MSTAFGLSAETIAIIRQVLARHPQVERAVIYGSRALGTHRPGSDIDLALYGPLTPQHLAALLDDLDETMLPYTFDLTRAAAITNPALADHIQRVGQPFYCRDAEP